MAELDRRSTPWPLIAVAMAYALALAVVLFWPTHVDGDGGFIRFDPVLDLIAGLGIPAWASYPWVEFAANAALFAPLGVLWVAAARAPRFRRIASAALIGAVVSIGAEVVQHVFIGERTTDPRDVVANTIGSASGALAAVLVVRSVGRRRAARAARAARRSGLGLADP